MTTSNIQNRKNMKKLFLFILSMLVLTSCQKEIQLNLDSSGNVRIAVDGRITNELKQHKIRLTTTRGYFDNQEVPALIVDSAYILEKNHGRRYDLTLTDKVNGIYLTPEFKGIAFETYTLMVYCGLGNFEATTYMDTVTKLDSISYEYEYSKIFKYGYYKIFMSAYDPPSTNFYRFYIYLNDTLINYKITDASYTNDELFNGIYMPHIELYDIRQEWVKHSSYALKVKMMSISKEEYDNINIYMNEIYGSGSIFNGPSSNIPSNLKNTSGGLDGMGFFAASAVSSLEIPLIKSHRDSTNVSDYLINIWIMN
jgi:hypothetical protein